jgi:hypothetical protein
MTVGAMLELEYAVTDDLLLLALGKDEAARRNLRAVLDARAKPGEGGDVAPSVAAHIAAVPAGWRRDLGHPGPPDAGSDEHRVQHDVGDGRPRHARA